MDAGEKFWSVFETICLVTFSMLILIAIAAIWSGIGYGIYYLITNVL